MWGQAAPTNIIPKESRIIPTRVGTRDTSTIVQIISRDHPHACGDKPCKDPAKSAMIGSSPRVWGEVVYDMFFIAFIGIIPTRVGTSYCWQSGHGLCKDHPHACGDKSMKMSSITSPKGSSPRVWGQDEEKDKSEEIKRIIPTRVGTSSRRL